MRQGNATNFNRRRFVAAGNKGDRGKPREPFRNCIHWSVPDDGDGKIRKRYLHPTKGWRTQIMGNQLIKGAMRFRGQSLATVL